MIDFTETLNTLNEYGDKIRNLYREKNIEAGYDPSAELQNISFNVESGNGNFAIVFHLPEYWRWAENGRPPGKMPPKGSLLKWMEFNQILPHQMQYQTGPRAGKTYMPTMESLEFLIRRKIGGTLWPYGPSPDGRPAVPGKVGGTEGKHTWEATENEIRNSLVRDVKAAIENDFRRYIEERTKNLK